MEWINDKRLEQLRESWIKNVMRVQGFTYAEAALLYDKIKPHAPKEVKS